MAQDSFANFVNVTASGEIHHSVSAEVHRSVQFFELFLNIRAHSRVADIGIDLAQRSHADAHGLEFRMVDIGGNNHAPAGHFVTNQFRRERFPARNVSHLLGNDPLPGVVHLGEVSVSIVGPAIFDPLRSRLGNTVCIDGSAIRASHGRLVLLSVYPKIIRRSLR